MQSTRLSRFRDHATRAIAALALVGGSAAALADPTFSVVPSPNPNASGNVINALAPVGSGDIWGVGFRNSSNLNGSRTLIQHWDGQSWSTVRSPNPGSPLSCSRFNSGNTLNAAAAVGPRNVWAVGFDFSCTTLLQTMIQHWNGFRWKNVASPALNTNDNAALNGIAARAANDIHAVGYQPAANGAVLTLIEHWNGSQWSVVASPNPSATGNFLAAVTATPDGDLWAVGHTVDEPTTSIQTLTLHSTDGVQWTVVPSPNPLPKSFLNQNVLSAVVASSANDVTAVGYILDFTNQRRLTLIEHWDGNSWQVVSSPNPSTAVGSFNVLTSVTAVDNRLYAAGYFANGGTAGNFQTLLERFDGGAWSILTSPGAGVAQQLFGIQAVPGTTEVWSAGAFSTNGTDPEGGLLIVPQTLSIFTPSG